MTLAGRFAPSPTGPLHMGSLISALASYLDIRQQGGEWFVRIDDLDPPRQDPNAPALILRTLAAHGLKGDRPVDYQSNHQARYQQAFGQIENQVFKGYIKDYTAVSIIADFAISEVAHYIISKHNADIGFVVNLNTKTVSFRRCKTCDVDVSILAKNLCGGSGSPAAAGGGLTSQFANLTKNFKPC